MKEKILKIKEKLTFKYIAVMTSLAIILILLVVYNEKDQHLSTGVSAIEVEVSKVEIKDMPIEINNIGTVVPIESVAINSRIDSQIAEILFKDGDRVTQGQVLFLLDDKAMQAQLKQIEAGVLRDQAQLTYLKNKYDRTLKIYQSGYETKENLDQARSAYEAQMATVKASEESVNSIKTQLDYTVITSPISGKTGTINTNIGNNVKANDTQALVTINQIDPIQVQFSISQKYFEGMHSALESSKVPIKAQITETKEIIDGYVEYIENNIDQNDNFAVRGIFSNAEEKLWPGMYVNVVVTIGYNKSVSIIPTSAVIIGQDDKKYVYVVTNNKASKREVTVLTISDKYAVVKEGLSLDELVVISGFSSIADGISVKISKEVSGNLL